MRHNLNKNLELPVFKGSPYRSNAVREMVSPLRFSRIVTLGFVQNNLFCDMSRFSNNKTLISGSAGIYINRQKVHSKKPKKVLSSTIDSFFFAIKNRLTASGVFVKLTVSKKQKKHLIKKLTVLKFYKKIRY